MTGFGCCDILYYNILKIYDFPVVLSAYKNVGSALRKFSDIPRFQCTISIDGADTIDEKQSQTSKLVMRKRQVKDDLEESILNGIKSTLLSRTGFRSNPIVIQAVGGGWTV